MTNSGDSGSTHPLKAGEKVDCSESIVNSEIKLRENKKITYVWLSIQIRSRQWKADYECFLPIKPVQNLSFMFTETNMLGLGV